jgi:hypothetical protein
LDTVKASSNAAAAITNNPFINPPLGDTENSISSKKQRILSLRFDIYQRHCLTAFDAITQQQRTGPERVGKRQRHV